MCQDKNAEFWKQLTQQYEPLNVKKCRDNAEQELNELIQNAKSQANATTCDVYDPMEEECKSDGGLPFTQNDPMEPEQNMVSIFFYLKQVVNQQQVSKFLLMGLENQLSTE